MQMLDHPNIVALKQCFFSTTDKEELYLNLVLEFVPETVNRIARNYNRINQRMSLIYVKLYTYQVCSNAVFLFYFTLCPLFPSALFIYIIFYGLFFNLSLHGGIIVQDLKFVYTSISLQEMTSLPMSDRHFVTI